jgi:hypothetical protein
MQESSAKKYKDVTKAEKRPEKRAMAIGDPAKKNWFNSSRTSSRNGKYILRIR